MDKTDAERVIEQKDDSDGNSDESSDEGPQYLFTSAIDVGSHFIDVTPDDQITFTAND